MVTSQLADSRIGKWFGYKSSILSGLSKQIR